MRTPQTEIDHQFFRRNQANACRFRGNQNLKLQQVDDARFDELGFAQWCDNPQDRLVGEKRGALGHGPDVTGKLHISQ